MWVGPSRCVNCIIGRPAPANACQTSEGPTPRRPIMRRLMPTAKTAVLPANHVSLQILNLPNPRLDD